MSSKFREDFERQLKLLNSLNENCINLLNKQGVQNKQPRQPNKMDDKNLSKIYENKEIK